MGIVFDEIADDIAAGHFVIIHAAIPSVVVDVFGVIVFALFDVGDFLGVTMDELG